MMYYATAAADQRLIKVTIIAIITAAASTASTVPIHFGLHYLIGACGMHLRCAQGMILQIACTAKYNLYDQSTLSYCQIVTVDSECSIDY
jgi:hypothetical protein